MVALVFERPALPVLYPSGQPEVGSPTQFRCAKALLGSVALSLDWLEDSYWRAPGCSKAAPASPRTVPTALPAGSPLRALALLCLILWGELVQEPVRWFP